MKKIVFTCDVCHEEIEHDKSLVEISVALKWPTLAFVSDFVKGILGTYHMHAECFKPDFLKGETNGCNTPSKES